MEKAAKESGYDFSGVQIPANPNELYSIRYSDFVMPLVKAVQEQQQLITTQKTDLETQKNKILSQEDRIQKLEEQVKTLLEKK